MLSAARRVRRCMPALAARVCALAAPAAVAARISHAAVSPVLIRVPLISSRGFRAVPSRAVRAKLPSDASPAAAPQPKAPADGDKPASDSSDDGPLKDQDKDSTDNEWRELVLLPPSEQAELINSLPMFRHTCEGVGRFTWATSSESCEGVLEPSDGGWWFSNLGQRLKSISTEGKIMAELSNYVQVADRPFDAWKGVQQAHDILFALFNTFHLAQSRAQLRAMCTPQVYTAVESSWSALDKFGLRLIYRSQVHNIQMLDLHIHDTDDWEPMGGGGGGGGGVKVPATGPLGVHPAGLPGQQVSAPPSSTNTQRMASDHPSPSKPNQQARAEAAADHRKPVRYADLDTQVDVAETFELWSTRPDQKLDDDTVAADAAATGNQSAAVPPPPPSADSKIVSDFEARLNSLEQQAIDASAGAQLNRVLSAINDTTTFATTDATATTTVAATTADTHAPAAAPTATPATAAPATAAPASASSSAVPPSPPTPPATPVTPATPATGPDADWAPPLLCLSTISGHGERGLRFWTPLPPRNTDDRGKFIVGSVVSNVIFGAGAADSSATMQFMEKFIKEQINIVRHPDAAKAPKPSWIIKDILD